MPGCINRYCFRLVVIAAGVIAIAYSAGAGGFPSPEKHSRKTAGGAVGRIESGIPLQILQEPEGRSVRYLYSPVLSAQGDTLYGINFINGSLEVWDFRTGALLAPVALPRSVRYYYR